VESVLPITVSGVFISMHELCQPIFSICPIEEKERESGWVGTWLLAKANPQHISKR